MKKDFVRGLLDGFPIGLGYLSVSFGFGISAVKLGLSVLAAVGISASNLTSAGQMAGITVISAAGTLLELALTQLIINIRYSLMGIALTQKLSGEFNTARRILCAFFITDEIFAVASSKREPITPKYMYGLFILPFIGWTLGTFIGAVAGEILPTSISNAMGIVIYGMFIAIVVQMCRVSKKVIISGAIAGAISILLYYFAKFISAGFAIIISAIAASAVCALFFPIKEEEL